MEEANPLKSVYKKSASLTLLISLYIVGVQIFGRWAPIKKKVIALSVEMEYSK